MRGMIQKGCVCSKTEDPVVQSGSVNEAPDKRLDEI